MKKLVLMSIAALFFSATVFAQPTPPPPPGDTPPPPPAPGEVPPPPPHPAKAKHMKGKKVKPPKPDEAPPAAE